MFNWRDYLNLAEQLAITTIDGVSEEARLRTAVSRAYYSVFNIADDFSKNKDRNLLEQIKSESVTDKQGNPRRRGDHEVVVEFLLRYPNNNIKEAGILLGGLKKERVSCDYRDNVKNISLLTTKVIQQAKDILDKIPNAEVRYR